MVKVAVLGRTGMVGSMAWDYFGQDKSIRMQDGIGLQLRADSELPLALFDNAACADLDWVINCIGVTNKRVGSLLRDSIEMNSLFPITLANLAAKYSFQVIQPATDCVYHFVGSNRTESSPHDAWDTYGKTKSLGEVVSPNVHHLRCSMIGPEFKNHLQLMDKMVRMQPKGAKIQGYTNHIWNGITTLHFAKICHGIIKNNFRLSHLQHIVPGDKMPKSMLLQILANEMNRKDICIDLAKSPIPVDRALKTEYPAINAQLWELAGYRTPLSIAAMVHELEGYIKERGIWVEKS